MAHVWDGRVFIHAKLQEAGKLSHIKKYQLVLEAFEQEPLDRGIDTYYTAADSQSNFRFLELLGFETNQEVYGGTYEIMKKCLQPYSL